MTKGRLEAFSDGVLAIIITIMVLELKPPHSDSLASLGHLWPVIISYVLSFVIIGIYWNNHHHMFQAASKISGSVLWANLHLLFWLSLFPFTTAWMGENNFSKVPVAFYGFVQFMAGLAYYILSRFLKKIHGADSYFSKALGGDSKGRLSILLYLIGIGASFLHPMIGFSLYFLVAVIWFVPDKRFEQNL
jgi:uncharacterized membrane protein